MDKRIKPALILAMMLILAVSASAAAKNNALSLTGSYGSTLLGLEYERRIGDFGFGAEASMLYSQPYYESEAFPLRLNGVLRYYVNLSPMLKPYISLAPGVLFAFYPVEPVSVGYNMAFNMHATAGVEFTPGTMRVAVEAGYEFITVFLYPQPVSEGWFFLKGAIGLRF